MPTRRTWNRTGTRTTNYRYGGTTVRYPGQTTNYRTNTGFSYNPSRFNTITKDIQARITSYRNLDQQFRGPGMVTWFSPTTANKWLKYVNNGAYVYKFTQNSFCRYFGQQWLTATPTTAYRWLRQKYGAGIKGVTRGKGNCWLVAATNRVTARPFNNYNWK